MCGFVGTWSPGEPVNLNAINAMNHSLLHRGPDGSGLWTDQDLGLAFGHRRLAIIDVSESGHQPMRSRSGRYVLVFNGEIYNHLELRKKLDSESYLPWFGGSDTETLLAGFERWGVAKTISMTVGMFAMAIWDYQDESLSLIRDRMGEKPLYYWIDKETKAGQLYFSSDIAALSFHPAFKRDVSRQSIALFLRYNYIPSPYTIYEGVHKLPPASILKLTRQTGAYEFCTELSQYWSLAEVANGDEMLLGERCEPLKTVDALESVLLTSIRSQMVSDVPLGAFLSGGIDSTAIVALMQNLSSTPVRTFTIGFHEEEFNEAAHAKKIAQYLGTDHTEKYVSEDEALSVIPRLSSIYSEPFAYSSQLPTAILSSLAREQVTVALSGDAGDELFCGYNRYIYTAKLWRVLKHIPIPLREQVRALLQSVPPDQWDRILNWWPGTAAGSIGDKLHKGAHLLSAPNMDALYEGFVSCWPQAETVVRGLEAHEARQCLANPEFGNLCDIEKMMLKDSVTYLPDDILVKVDRASMAASLEARAPFLDHRVVEFAWQVPMAMKLRGGHGKWILRQLLKRYVPESLTNRPKMGFGIPIARWLRGPLSDWAIDLLNEKKIREDGYFNADIVTKKLTEHMKGQRNWHHQLWAILMFQQWLEQHKP